MAAQPVAAADPQERGSHNELLSAWAMPETLSHLGRAVELGVSPLSNEVARFASAVERVNK